jgi:hypothetical protein
MSALLTGRPQEFQHNPALVTTRGECRSCASKRSWRTGDATWLLHLTAPVLRGAVLTENVFLLACRLDGHKMRGAAEPGGDHSGSGFLEDAVEAQAASVLCDVAG